MLRATNMAFAVVLAMCLACSDAAPNVSKTHPDMKPAESVVVGSTSSLIENRQCYVYKYPVYTANACSEQCAKDGFATFYWFQIDSECICCT